MFSEIIMAGESLEVSGTIFSLQAKSVLFIGSSTGTHDFATITS
uniref:Uncharacterized protein n=1 Tax=Moniliophthora roreri TaxID=221103 RepID=A0A0W0FNZ5_MONRR